MMCHALGVRLSKTIGEIEAMPYAELIDWMAYAEIEKEARERNA